jgi:acyl-CoA synthetase (AMP-forming)/AMP-acid ligase II
MSKHLSDLEPGWTGPPLPPPDDRPVHERLLVGGRLVAADGVDVLDEDALAAAAARTAGELAARGVRPGDAVGVQAPNAPSWAAAAIGVLAAGAALAPVSPAAGGPDADRHLALARARARLDGRLPSGAPTARGRRLPSTAPGTVALLPASSGTTGLPKAVELTHGNLAAALAQVQHGLRLTAGDVVLAAAPFAHVMGFVAGLAAPLAAGARVVTLARPAPGPVVAAVARHGVTVLVVPPPVAAALAAVPATTASDPLRSLQLVVCGGAPLPPAVQARLAARLPGAVIAQGYGMTETTLPIPVPDRVTGTPPGATGRLAPGTRLRVVDPDTGADRPAGAPGELWVRGPQVTPGYRGDEAATRALFAPGGWLRTGDLGLVGEDGQVRVVDRLKELIKVNALQVAPARLEALLLGRADVADAVVVARPHPRTGEVPVAVVVPRGPLDAEAVRAWVAERVAPHERLAAVLEAPAIPRTPAGKALRRELRSWPAVRGDAPAPGRVTRRPEAHPRG